MPREMKDNREEMAPLRSLPLDFISMPFDGLWHRRMRPTRRPFPEMGPLIGAHVATEWPHVASHS